MIAWLFMFASCRDSGDFGVGTWADRPSPELVEIEFSPGITIGDSDWGVSEIRWFRMWSDGVEVDSDRITIGEGYGAYVVRVLVTGIPPEQDELELSGVLYWTEGPVPRGATSTIRGRVKIR